jgi:tRNA (mo5U34)-methyltransferase
MRGRWPVLLDALGGSIEGLSVLDCACNCGGWTVHAARAGAKRVLGFDVVDRYIEQANFVKTVLKDELPQLEFRKMKVEDVSPESVGTFDVTLFFGILYHLPDPVSAMEKIASVTERALFVATRTFEPPSRWPRRNVEQSFWRTDIRIPTPSEVSTANLWVDKPIWQFMPTRLAVVDLLKYVGFPKVTNVMRNGKPTKLFLALR